MNILVSLRSSESLKPEELVSYYHGMDDGGGPNYHSQYRLLTNGKMQVRTEDEIEWRDV